MTRRTRTTGWWLMADAAFALDAEALRQLGNIAEQLGKLQSALPDYLWLDTSINVLTSVDGEKPGLDEKAAIGAMEFNDFGDYHYLPFASPRRRAKTS